MLSPDQLQVAVFALSVLKVAGLAWLAYQQAVTKAAVLEMREQERDRADSRFVHVETCLAYRQGFGGRMDAVERQMGG